MSTYYKVTHRQAKPGRTDAHSDAQTPAYRKQARQ